MFCRHHTDAAVRKLITMIAERDAAILERNSAIAEKVAAREERDTALLQRDMAYADRDSAIEERDAAVAALEIAMTDRNILEKRVATKDSKLFQSFSMTKNCTLLGAIQPSSLSTSRFSSIVAEQSDLCRNGSSKEDQVGLSRKRKIVVKSTLDRTLRTKRSYLSANEERGHEIGVKQQCYRWGNGGWQSSCCTTMISMYPLPMNPTKRGSRLAGRKMSAGAFEKLLEKLALEGVNVNYPVDLKDHWAKHGTNRYVTLR
ncbi:hypothetical protein AXG93_2535s1000 [Marchantia polymorpha subsp. ruderalis]|uniref:GAGA-binding transcriptional activator n=1 Tax=Marchantia polymorpha subsp. ruderalis TaxID=1480154 RepID=A0A176WT74_MARPO|nr:hypothetical protein AXG93_2535s1000 [Marchantia polymorpha subsp. ruderalis]